MLWKAFWKYACFGTVVKECFSADGYIFFSVCECIRTFRVLIEEQETWSIGHTRQKSSSFKLIGAFGISFIHISSLSISTNNNVGLTHIINMVASKILTAALLCVLYSTSYAVSPLRPRLQLVINKLFTAISMFNGCRRPN